MRRRAYEIVEVARPDDPASRGFDYAILLLIALNVVAFVLESVPGAYGAAPALFEWFDHVSIAVFSVEYALRIWSCVEDPRHTHPLTGRLRFMLRPMPLIDLIAILPAYLPLLGVDLRVFRALRLFRLARILKFGRYSRALRIIARVALDKREELVTSLAFLLVLLLLASSVMYYAEREVQPEHFGSIPRAMWWAVATLTTVGYGDVYPVTAIGRLLGAVAAVLGIGLFALPAGILGSAFMEEIQNRGGGAPPAAGGGPPEAEPAATLPDASKRCPHCGK